jgi:hypothetical protein
MRAARRTTDAGRARSLAAALAFLFGSVAFYADHMASAPRFTQNPSDSHGSPTLVVAAPAALPAGGENAHAGAQAPREAKTTIAWTRPWGNKS